MFIVYREILATFKFGEMARNAYFLIWCFFIWRIADLERITSLFSLDRSRIIYNYVSKYPRVHVNMECGVINYPGQLLDIEFEFTRFIRAN